MADTDNADDESTVTLDEALSFAADMAGKEADEFEGEVPEHAAGLLVSRSDDLLRATRRFEMADASEQAEGFDTDEKADAIESRAVSVLLALGTLQYEHEDVDIASAFEERKKLVEEYEAFTDAMEEVDSREEAEQVIEEKMTPRVEELMMKQQQQAGMGVDVGENVDAEEYDPDERNRDVQ